MCTEEKLTTVDELLLSQEDQTQTHNMPDVQMDSRWTDLTQTSIMLINRCDVGLKCLSVYQNACFLLLL